MAAHQTEIGLISYSQFAAAIALIWRPRWRNAVSALFPTQEYCERVWLAPVAHYPLDLLKEAMIRCAQKLAYPPNPVDLRQSCHLVAVERGWPPITRYDDHTTPINEESWQLVARWIEMIEGDDPRQILLGLDEMDGYLEREGAMTRVDRGDGSDYAFFKAKAERLAKREREP